MLSKKIILINVINICVAMKYFRHLDLPHTNSSEGRRFRNPKRFMAMPSPFTCVEWWRICLDEAQVRIVRNQEIMYFLLKGTGNVLPLLFK